MYKILSSTDPLTGEEVQIIQRISDGLFIPMVVGNRHYEEYQLWLEETE